MSSLSLSYNSDSTDIDYIQVQLSVTRQAYAFIRNLSIQPPAKLYANSTITNIVIRAGQGRHHWSREDVGAALRRRLVCPPGLFQEEERDNDGVADLHRTLCERERGGSGRARRAIYAGLDETRNGLLEGIVLGEQLYA